MIDVNLLLQAMNAQTTRPLPARAPTREQAAIAAEVPPWSSRATRVPDEDTVRRLMGGAPAIAREARSAIGRDPALSDIRTVFAAHEGLNALRLIAERMAAEDTSTFDRTRLAARFEALVPEVDQFLAGIALDRAVVVRGADLRRAETDPFVRTARTYTTGVVHTGPPDAVMAGLETAAGFTITVRRAGVDTPVFVDFAAISGPRSLDAVVAQANTALEQAGFSTRLERVKIGTARADGFIPGEDFGIRVRGGVAELASFSAPDAQPAVYLVGNTGPEARQVGAITKFSDDGSAPATLFTRRIEADRAPDRVSRPAGATEDIRTAVEPPPLRVRASAATEDGGLVVLAQVEGSVAGQRVLGERDVVLQRRDSQGAVIWTRMIGAEALADGAAVAVGPDGRIAVAGTVTGVLDTNETRRGQDGFLTMFDAAGQQAWTRRIAGVGTEEVTAVAIGADGTVAVAGRSTGSGSAGGADGWLQTFGADGTNGLTQTMASGSAEGITALAATADGFVVALRTDQGGAVRRLDAAGAVVWEQALPDLGGGAISAIAVEGTRIVLSGTVGANADLGAWTPPGPASGERDALLIALDDGVTPQLAWSRRLGGGGDDMATAIRLSGGAVFVAGSTTGGIDGNPMSDRINAFAARLDGATGATSWVRQVSGREGQSGGVGIAVDPAGSSILDRLGLPTGTLRFDEATRVVDRTPARAGDEFFVRIDGGPPRRIVLQADDTFRSLAFRIGRALGLDGTAEVRTRDGADRLGIVPRGDARIELVRGAAGRDATEALGLVPGLVRASPAAQAGRTQTIQPPVIALDFDPTRVPRTREEAEALVDALAASQSRLRTAYRTITQDPAVLAAEQRPGRTGGTVPEALRRQLANYQAGLARLGG